jgi:hypothetical protein
MPAAATLLTLLPLLFSVAVADQRRVDTAAIPQCVDDLLGSAMPPVQCLAAGLLALNDKMEVLDRPVWGSVSQYMTCTCPLTWRDLHKDFTFFESTSRTGGLGKLMVEDKFENWWCTIDHMCAPPGDYMCFVWGEVERRFIPWGLNSELKLVRKGPFAAVDAPSSRLLVQVAALKQEVTERLIALESGGQGGEIAALMQNVTALQMLMQNVTALQMTAFKQEVTERLIALERLIAHERLIAINESGQGAVLDALTSLAFKWRAAPLAFSGPCSSTCGTGTRRRTVECVLDGGVTNTVFCDARSRPDELETCNDYSMCTYYWLPLPWGACSNTCGPGTRQRIVHCVRTDAAKTLVNSNLW